MMHTPSRSAPAWIAAFVAAAWWAAPYPGGALPATLPVALAQDGDAAAEVDLAALEAEVSGLRERMEGAFRAVEKDHALVREAAFAEKPGERCLAAAAAVAGGARAEGGATAADVVDGALADYRPSDGDVSVFTLRVVLPQVFDGARTDTAAEPAALLVAAARDALSAETADLAWDGPFQSLPVVELYRDARSRLETAKKAAAAQAEAEAPGAAGRESDMVLFERGRGQVGPWSGWVQVFNGKENRRQNASRKPIYVDRYEVTCAQYAAFVNAQREGKRKGLLPGGWSLAEDGKAKIPEGMDRHPVTRVKYEQAVAYAKHWGKRLPFEDEWELVAAGLDKSGRTYPWGNDLGERTLGTKTGGASGTARVDAYPDDVSPEGVVGLAGNVAEMVATQPDRTDLARGRVPKGGEVIVRGGNFKAVVEEAKTTFRWIVDPTEGAPNVGFRCVMDQLDYKRRFGK